MHQKRRKGNKSAEVKTSIGESEATGARRESEEFDNLNPKNSLAAQTDLKSTLSSKESQSIGQTRSITNKVIPIQSRGYDTDDSLNSGLLSFCWSPPIPTPPPDSHQPNSTSSPSSSSLPQHAADLVSISSLSRHSRYFGVSPTWQHPRLLTMNASRHQLRDKTA